MAPKGLKIFVYDPLLKSKEIYLMEGWKKQKIGTSTINTHATNYCTKGNRKQYGLKHYVTATLHVLQGLTINKLATEINVFSSDYKLWDCAQLLVLLSRTKKSQDVIFVGNKENTIISIVQITKTSSQWTDYMENVVKILSQSSQNDTNRIPIVEHTEFPLDLKCISIPRCNTGYVYFLISTRDTTKTYIGQTMNLYKRLSQHNQGFGTQFTQRIDLRPWVLYGYISGFDRKRSLMLSIEHEWKSVRNHLISSGVRNPKDLCRSAERFAHQQNGSTLHLILNF